MTKRKTVLAEARLAGYRNDRRYFLRLIVESRVDRAAMSDAWASGATQQLLERPA